MRRFWVMALCVALAGCGGDGGSNSTDPPALPVAVDLRIQNLPQETSVWCWAAVTQQIVLWLRGANQTPPQCALVALANNADPNYCCSFPQACSVTGSLQQIQALIAYFGGRYSAIAPPTDAMTLYRTLAAGHPVIMAVQSSPYSGHVIVIRGMAWSETAAGRQAVLYVNDPLAYFSQAVPFDQVLPYWQAAIVVN
jgi:hypothetical protein